MAQMGHFFDDIKYSFFESYQIPFNKKTTLLKYFWYVYETAIPNFCLLWKKRNSKYTN